MTPTTTPDPQVILGQTPIQEAVTAEIFTGKRGRLRAYLFELATGTAYPVLALAFFIDPKTTSLHSVVSQRIYPFDHLWNLGFIVGGLCTLYGVIAPRLHIRAFGLIILGTALAMQVTAAVFTRPDLRESFNAIYATACFMRAYLVVRLYLLYKRSAATGPWQGGR